MDILKHHEMMLTTYFDPELSWYLFYTSELIDTYTKLKGDTKKTFFGVQSSNQKELNELEYKYQKILSERYYEDCVERKVKPPKIVCKLCGLTEFYVDENLHTCVHCGTELLIGLDIIKNDADTNRINVYIPVAYDRTNTFTAVLTEFVKSNEDQSQLYTDFKELHDIYFITYPENNLPNMPLIVYKILLKNGLDVTKFSEKIKNRKQVRLDNCIKLLKWFSLS